MAEADDPEVSGREPRPAAPSGRFWQRYSGRAPTPEEGPPTPEGDEGPGEATGGSGEGERSEAEEDERAEPAPDRGGSPAWDDHLDGHQCLDWCPICRGAELLRDAVPPELQEQFRTVQRDALLLAQAMIESQLERMRAQQDFRRASESEPGATHDGDDDPGVSSIPID